MYSSEATHWSQHWNSNCIYKGFFSLKFSIWVKCYFDPLKSTFKDMVTAEFESVAEKNIKGFDGWVDYQSLVNYVKTVFPDMALSKFWSLSYDDLVSQLMLYLEIDAAKAVFFDFVINKHGMSSKDIIYKQMKMLNAVLDVDREFIEFQHGLLDIKDKSVHVKIDEVLDVTPKE